MKRPRSESKNKSAVDRPLLCALDKRVKKNKCEDALRIVVSLSINPKKDILQLNRILKTITNKRAALPKSQSKDIDPSIQEFLHELAKKKQEHLALEQQKLQRKAEEKKQEVALSYIKHFFKILPAGTSGKEIEDCFEDVLIKRQDQISSRAIEEMILILSNPTK